MGDECFLCVSNETDPIVYGELKESGGIKVHYYCLVSNFSECFYFDKTFLKF